MNATTTQLLSSGEFRKLRYDTTPVKSVSANVSFYTNNSKMPNFELWRSCRKWAIWYENILDSRMPGQMGNSETTETSEMKINKHLRGSGLCQPCCWECDAMKKCKWSTRFQNSSNIKIV